MAFLPWILLCVLAAAQIAGRLPGQYNGRCVLGYSRLIV
jgi:hypothetical protein